MPPAPPLQRANSAPSFQLQRSLSSSSIESDESTASSSSTASKLTRKRLAGYQLMVLETLHSNNNTPTREQREVAAREGNMDLKAVTIWFQNKRSAERRTVLRNTTNSGCLSNTERPILHVPARSLSSPNLNFGQSSIPTTGLSSTSTTSAPSTSTSTTTTSPTVPFSFDALPVHIHTIRNPHPPRVRLRTPSPPRRTTSKPTRLTLDLVASRTERAVAIPISPRADAPAWDNMPESPARPPPSPESIRRRVSGLSLGPARGRTLEWACEVARRREKRKGDRERDEETVFSASLVEKDSEVQEAEQTPDSSSRKRPLRRAAVAAQQKAAAAMTSRPSKVASKATIMAKATSSTPSSSQRRPRTLTRARTTDELKSPFKAQGSVTVDTDKVLDSSPAKRPRNTRRSSHADLLAVPSTSTADVVSPRECQPSPSSSATSDQSLALSQSSTVVDRDSSQSNSGSKSKSDLGSNPKKSSKTLVAKSSTKKATAAVSSAPRTFKEIRGKEGLDDEMLQAAWALCGLGQAKALMA